MSLAKPAATWSLVAGKRHLSVSYAASTWEGAASIVEASGQTVSASVKLAYGADGTLTSASISEDGPVALFGVVDLTSFSMGHAGSNWSFSAANAADGGSVTATMTATGGVVSQPVPLPTPASAT
jgi:hypothetical protein